jgi:uncharacterized damage-inducible protein DinB
MTISVPRFAIKLAGRECSRWNCLITQFKYTSILPSKSSSKSKKSKKSGGRDFQTADRNVVGTLAHVFAGDRLWLARLSGAPAPGFIDDEDRSLAALQTGWPPVFEGWKRWATTLTDAEAQAQFAYTDTKGRPWRQRFGR